MLVRVKGTEPRRKLGKLDATGSLCHRDPTHRPRISCRLAARPGNSPNSVKRLDLGEATSIAVG